MMTARFKGGSDRYRRRRVAQPHRQIAQPALIAGTAQRRTGGTLQELLLGPQEQGCQLTVVEPMAGFEIVLVSRRRKLVPGAHQLAVIAAEHSVADGFAQLHRDSAL